MIRLGKTDTLSGDGSMDMGKEIIQARDCELAQCHTEHYPSTKDRQKNMPVMEDSHEHIIVSTVHSTFLYSSINTSRCRPRQQ